MGNLKLPLLPPILVGVLLTPLAGLAPRLASQSGDGAAHGELSPPIQGEDVAAAARVAALDWTDAEVKQALASVRRAVSGFVSRRRYPLGNGVPPAWRQRRGVPAGWVPPEGARLKLPDVTRPRDLRELHFASARELAALVRSRQVSCRELVDLFLARLEEVNPTLHCVVHLLPERARARAEELDGLLEGGIWLGPMHGIPFGAKDLLAATGAPTTWGAKPYRDRVLDADAAAIREVEDRGGILIAKLSLGALAMGDVWFGGVTRNPWNPEQGSSGSSAGPASATAAGAIPFAIGSETYGSILSPARRCGVTGLRPTHGLVPMDGAMVLSWSLDKLGPMGRTADDIAFLFEALGPEKGIEGQGYGFSWPAEVPLEELVVGVVAGDFPEGQRQVLEELAALGCTVKEVPWPVEGPAREAMVMLTCEAAAAFDAFSREGRDDQLTRQGAGAWPNLLRAARLVPAVEYLQAQRVRTLLREQVDAALAGVDVLVHPSHRRLALFNLTGHPTGVAPVPMDEDAAPRGAIGFTAKRFDEARILALMAAWQGSSGRGVPQPPAFR